MGVATALAAVGAGTAIYGTVKGAQAGAQAADAQGRIAQAQEAAAKEATKFAAPTMQELSTLNNQVKLYDTAYSNAKTQLDTLQNEIVSTYGQNILEQGKQLHDQLVGGTSAVTQLASQQIERQRVQYQQQLVDKLGPGALTSSAGIQAMASFNREAASSLATTQENALNGMISRIGGLQSGQSSAVQGVLGINSSLSGMLQSIQGTQDNFQKRQMGAGFQQAQFAGSSEVAGLANARNSANTAAGIANLGGMALGYGLSNLSQKGATNTTSTDAGARPTLASGTFDSNSVNKPFGLGADTNLGSGLSMADLQGPPSPNQYGSNTPNTFQKLQNSNSFAPLVGPYRPQG